MPLHYIYEHIHIFLYYDIYHIKIRQEQENSLTLGEISSIVVSEGQDMNDISICVSRLNKHISIKRPYMYI